MPIKNQACRRRASATVFPTKDHFSLLTVGKFLMSKDKMTTNLLIDPTGLASQFMSLGNLHSIKQNESSHWAIANGGVC